MRYGPFVVLLACASAAPASAQQSPMRAGRWEVTVQMQVPGAPMALPPMTTTQCVTEEQLKKDPGSGLPSGMQQGAAQNACKVSDYKVAGRAVSWKMACTAPMAMAADGELTFTDDSYTGTMKMTTPQAMTMKMTGKRLGDCLP